MLANLACCNIQQLMKSGTAVLMTPFCCTVRMALLHLLGYKRKNVACYNKAMIQLALSSVYVHSPVRAGITVDATALSGGWAACSTGSSSRHVD
jgi:hypothetical protein